MSSTEPVYSLDEIAEIQDADMVRSAKALTAHFESMSHVTLDDLGAGLDEMIKVLERKADFNTFTENVNITNRSWLN